MVIEAGPEKRTVPLGHVSELLVVGHARISTAVIADLAERGVPLHFFGHPARPPSSVWGPLEGRVDALRTQFTAGETERLAAARALVGAKIANSGWVLRRVGQRVRLPDWGVADAPDADTLRGLEGHAARVYFAALAQAVPDWDFRGRMYRPPPDPVNAALSFAYALLLGRTLAAVSRVGLHPAVGTLHVSHGRRPALALDVMEPFRAPVCDLTVLSLLRSGQLRRDRFEQRGGEVRLGQQGCAVVAQSVGRRMQDWKIDAALLAQVRAVGQAWAGGSCSCWSPPVRA